MSEAGLDAAGYSGHSLRAGLATSASERGLTGEKIRTQTRHASAQSLGIYVRSVQDWNENAAAISLRSRIER